MKSFMEMGPHVFPKSGTQTHRQTDTATLYIDDWGKILNTGHATLTTPLLACGLAFDNFDTVHMHAKLDDSSFSRSRDIIAGVKIQSASRDPDHDALEVICHLCDYMHATFDHCSFSRSVDMIGAVASPGFGARRGTKVS